MRTKLSLAFVLVIFIALISNLIFERLIMRDFDEYTRGTREDHLYWVLAAMEGSYQDGRWDMNLLSEAVHSFADSGNQLLLLIGMRRARRREDHVHEFGYADQLLAFNLGPRFSLALVDRLSAACIVNSQAVAAAYRRQIDPSKLHMLHCSVNLPQPPAVDDEPDDRPDGHPIRCVLVGALGEWKGQEDAILAKVEKDHGASFEAKALPDLCGYGDLTLGGDRALQDG